MTELSNASIKNLNKNELKIELTNRGLGTQRTKEETKQTTNSNTRHGH